MIEELEFRKKTQETFDRIQKAFDEIDPDVAECEPGLGSVTITLSDQSRVILSTQPSVRQVWLAVAAKAVALHFSHEVSDSSRFGYLWMDDKGKGIELLSFLEKFLNFEAGVPVKLSQ